MFRSSFRSNARSSRDISGVVAAATAAMLASAVLATSASADTTISRSDGSTIAAVAEQATKAAQVDVLVDGLGSAADVAVGADGFVYVLDGGAVDAADRRSTVYKVDPHTGAKQHIVTTEAWEEPFFMSVDTAHGVAYLTEHQDVLRLDLATGATEEFVEYNPNYSTGRAVPDPAGKYVYFTQTNVWSKQITLQRVPASGGVPTQVASLGSGMTGASVAVDANNVYVRTSSSLLRGGGLVKVDPTTGQVTTIAEDGKLKIGTGIALDGSGGAYVAGLLFGTIARVDLATGEVGSALVTGLKNPGGLGLGSDGTLYVSEITSGTVSKITGLSSH